MDINKFKESFHFSYDSTVPLYMQLASFFKIQIQAEELHIDEQMPPEETLCNILGCSRTTVRQAMNLLAKEHYITRCRGKGTFVTIPKVERNMNHLYSFSEDMRALGMVPSSQILKAAVIQSPPSSVKDILKMPGKQTTVFKLLRLRCSNDVPFLIEETYIPYYLCNGIEQFNFEASSLYHILTDHYKLNLHHASENIEAIILSEKEADLLQCQSALPVAGYRIHRISSLESGFIFEYTSSVTRADKCTFHIDLYNNSDLGEHIQREYY